MSIISHFNLPEYFLLLVFRIIHNKKKKIRFISGLKKIFREGGNVGKVIILGDLKHDFGSILGQEWKGVREILDFLKERSKEIILIKGNHDVNLGPIAKKEGLEIVDYYVEGGVCFLHGHKLFPECLDEKIKTLILGHRHPAVILYDGYKKEKYKCFLVGKWKRR